MTVVEQLAADIRESNRQVMESVARSKESCRKVDSQIDYINCYMKSSEVFKKWP